LLGWRLFACVLLHNPPKYLIQKKSKYIRYQPAVLSLSFTMPASHAALLLLLAMSLQQIPAAPLISPGSESQQHPQHDESVAKFHLVANTDVTKRVSSKGLMCASSALYCFAVVVILTPRILSFQLRILLPRVWISSRNVDAPNQEWAGCLWWRQSCQRKHGHLHGDERGEFTFLMLCAVAERAS
jgi:hypothetical protein